VFKSITFEDILFRYFSDDILIHEIKKKWSRNFKKGVKTEKNIFAKSYDKSEQE
jgi:hypothetical protein